MLFKGAEESSEVAIHRYSQLLSTKILGEQPPRDSQDVITEVSIAPQTEEDYEAHQSLVQPRSLGLGSS